MKWINVEEKLPEETGRYWCYVKGMACLGVFYQQDNCSFNKEDCRWNSEAWTNRCETVTHWMPLPEPPE